MLTRSTGLGAFVSDLLERVVCAALENDDAQVRNLLSPGQTSG
jgi:hypothetical protein